jgi:sulfoxide reductase heme-binding subunit YedZ
VHWLADACWPIALAHGFGSGTDMRNGLLLALAVCCTAAVAAATCWRIATAVKAPRAAERPALALAAADRVGPRHADRDLTRAGSR